VGEIHVDERVGSDYDLSLFKAVKRSRVSEVGDEWCSGKGTKDVIGAPPGVRSGNGGNGSGVAEETGVALRPSEIATQKCFGGNGSQDGEFALAPASLARTRGLTHPKLSSSNLSKPSNSSNPSLITDTLETSRKLMITLPKEVLPSPTADIAFGLNVSADASALLTKRAHSESTIEYVNVGIDAEKMGNEARFINDYRGVPISLPGVRSTSAKTHTILTRPRPNAFFREVWIEGMLCMGVWSEKEGIRKGEEIVLSYGKGWWSARNQFGLEEAGG
jgi:hypothetical protein